MDEYNNFVSGNWESTSDRVPNINPSNYDEVIGEVSIASEDIIKDAIDSAQNARRDWSRVSIQTRFEILEKIGNNLMANKEAIAKSLSHEEGKILQEADAEVVRAAQIFKFYAGECLRIVGDSQASLKKGVEIQVAREPVGSIAVITPWNFPIAIPAWKTAAALAYGNTVVFKPSTTVPATASWMAKAIEMSGAPRGVFNMVYFAGGKSGRDLISNPGVAGVSFTGSNEVGNTIAKSCIDGGKKCQIEMGGKNPLIVLEDAELDIAVDATINGAFFSTGQRCTASSRIIVQDRIYDKFIEKLISKMDSLTVGDALDSKIDIGPVVNAAQLERNLQFVEIAESEGCEVIGGNRLEGGGYFQKPGLFLNAKSSYKSSREEIFGPLASVIRVTSVEEALKVANDTQFGLTSSVFTKSLHLAKFFKRNLVSGVVMVNLPTVGLDYHVPFGGTKLSSYGPRELGSYARDFYTNTKTVYIN